MNMQLWLDAVIKEKIKKPMPLLSSPAAELMGVDVSDLARDGALQAKAMMLFSERYDSLAAVSMMDLSVEAEAFGAKTVYSDGEVPTVTGALIRSRGDAEALPVPDMNSGRLGEYIKAIRLASEKITDRPIFAGIIGPFSLVGRLMDVSEAMMCCYDDPETVEIMLEKASEFLIKYALGFKAAGASGIIMAEPLAGMLSPALEEEFSMSYVKRIADAVQDESFILIYHNCGGNINLMCDSFSRNGASAYHFGNSVKITDMLEKMPCDKVTMGNVDPAGIIKNGTPDDVRAAVTEIMESASEYSSFVLSSGCDIPPETKIENIDAFFLASREFYEKRYNV